jgi:chaperonin cofactor prefoldin
VVANQRHDEVMQDVSSLRSAVEAVPAQLRDLKKEQAQSRDRIDRLAAQRDEWEARLGELRKAIPAPFDESKLDALRRSIDGNLAAGLTKQQIDLKALEKTLRTVERSCDRLGERLDDLERTAHEDGSLVQALDSVERIAGSAFTCVKEMLEERVAATASEVTVRGALRVESAALRNVLVLRFEEYMQAGGAPVRLKWGAAGTLRYYVGMRDLGAFEQDCAEAIRTFRDSVTSTVEEPTRPTPHDAFFSILLSLAQAESAFAQLGPLVIARTPDAFGCGLLDREGMRAFDVERCLGDPGATPDEMNRWSPGAFVDLSSLARPSSAA